MRRVSLIVGSVVILLSAGWLFWNSQPVEAQSSVGIGEWRMFSENVAGTGGSSAGQATLALTGNRVYGTTWMYHTTTGEVRRMFSNCGESYPDGCAFVLPVLSASESAAGFQPEPRP